MRHATLRQLKVFHTVARHLSFSGAAEELHLTQPAVSAQVKELESHAGLPLFERIGRRTYLTAAGSELMAHSHAILAQVQDADEAMARLQGVAGGTLNVAVISAGDYFFPRLVADFMRQHGNIKLALTVHNREDLLRALAENLTDLAVMVRPPEGLDTVHEAFAPHAYVVVAAAGHPLARQRKVSIDRLLREPFVTREHGSDTWIAMKEAFGPRMPEIGVAMEIRSNETIKQAVLAGMGVSFMSEHAVALEVDIGRLAVLNVEGFPAMRQWFVVHRRSKRLPPVAVAFRQFLLAEGARWIERATHVVPRRTGAPRNAAPVGKGTPGVRPQRRK